MKAMKNTRTTAVAVALVACSSLVLSACGSSDAGGSSSKTVKVGFVLPLSGPGGVYSDSVTSGMELAVQELKKSKPGGYSIEVKTVDDATDPKTASQVCQQLVGSTKVDVIVAFQTSAATPACFSQAKRENVPYIRANESAGDFCDAGFFQTGKIANQQIAPMVDYLHDKEGAQKFFLVGSDYNYGHGALKFAKEHVTKSGFDVVGERYEALGASNFSTDIAAIAKAKPDVIISAVVGADQVAFFKQLRNDPRTKDVLVASTSFNPQAVGPAAAGSYGATSYDVTSSKATNTKYVADLQAKFGKDVPLQEFGMWSYNAFGLLGTALEKVSSVNSKDLIAALSDAQFDGPMGAISFDKSNHYAAQPIFIQKAESTEDISTKGSFDAQQPDPGCTINKG